MSPGDVRERESYLLGSLRHEGLARAINAVFLDDGAATRTQAEQSGASALVQVSTRTEVHFPTPHNGLLPDTCAHPGSPTPHTHPAARPCPLPARAQGSTGAGPAVDPDFPAMARYNLLALANGLRAGVQDPGLASPGSLLRFNAAVVPVKPSVFRLPRIGAPPVAPLLEGARVM
jgi:hypothetical protein